MSDAPVKPVDDDEASLGMLRAIAERVDAAGKVRLHQSEIPFFQTEHGTEWIEQVSLEDDAYRITESGRRALGLPTTPDPG